MKQNFTVRQGVDRCGQSLIPFLEPRIMERWFSWPNVVLLSPVPIVTLWLALWVWRAIDRRAEFLPFLRAIALFTMGYVGLAISLWPNIVPHVINLWDAAAAPPIPGVSPRRHALPAAGDRWIHRVVILGLSRQGACRRRIPLGEAPKDQFDCKSP